MLVLETPKNGSITVPMSKWDEALSTLLSEDNRGRARNILKYGGSLHIEFDQETVLDVTESTEDEDFTIQRLA